MIIRYSALSLSNSRDTLCHHFLNRIGFRLQPLWSLTMKRKINPGFRDGVKDLTLSDGIPRLQRTISETGPSIPSDEEHAKVQVVEKSFGLADESIMAPMMNHPSGLSTVHGRIRYSSENDVAGLVKTYLERILYALGATDVEIHSEIATFNIRPDLWVVSVRGIPMGVVQVKKPDVPGKPKALDHPNVLGELFDFLRHLPNFHGVSPAFGILTNMNTWRMAWLPTESGDVDLVAGQEEAFKDEDKGGADLLEGGQEEHPPIPSIQEEDDDTEENQEAFKDDCSARLMHVSRIFRKNEPDTLIRAITSVLCKMIRSTATPFPTPFANLEQRTILKFVRSEATSVVWTQLHVKPQWDKVGRPQKFLFAVQDLGRGADGRVWLTCTTSGAICVLKFPLDGKAETVDREHSSWQAAYPSIRTYKETWCGHVALRMPYFAPIQEGERESKIGLVHDTLTISFASKGMIHADVFWRNIGTYKDDRGEEKAVVFDMGRVKFSDTAADSGWVEKECGRLLLSETEEESEEYY